MKIIKLKACWPILPVAYPRFFILRNLCVSLVLDRIQVLCINPLKYGCLESWLLPEIEGRLVERTQHNYPSRYDHPVVTWPPHLPQGYHFLYKNFNQWFGGDMWETCGRHVGDMWETWGRHRGDTGETRGRHVGDMWETCGSQIIITLDSRSWGVGLRLGQVIVLCSWVRLSFYSHFPQSTTLHLRV